MSSISYEQRLPSPALASHVECYWTLRGRAMPEDAADHGAERVLPDGRVEIVFNCGGAVVQTRDGVAHRQPATLLVGPTTRAVLIRPTGALHMVGIRLRHGSAPAVLGVPAAPLTDTMHSLHDVATFPSSFREQLAESVSFAMQIAIIERQLMARLARARLVASRSTSIAVARILASEGAIGIARVATDAGLSTRQLARRFGQDVGVGPKLLSRLARFHAVLRLVETEGPPTLASAAARAGYVDQSHLVRDFREFAGLTPSAYFRSHHQLTTFFLELEPAEGSRDAWAPPSGTAGARGDR